MNNIQKIRDITKYLNNNTVSTELPAGATRRYEPEIGVKKHNERIHKESAYADSYKNLPFTFSAPKKNKSSILKQCTNCESLVYVHKTCVGVVCKTCNKYSSVKEIQ